MNYLREKADTLDAFSQVTTRRSIIATNGQRIFTKDRIAGGAPPPPPQKKNIASSPMEIRALAALRSVQPFVL